MSGQPSALPRVDHHKHLGSVGAAKLVSGPPPAAPYQPVDADQLIAQLDVAGTQRAVVLSVAYWFGSPRFTLPNEYELVRAENDWTAEQVARHPARLVPFCSVNPTKDYAVQEIERCARALGMRGLKLHFGSSQVDVRNADHLVRTRQVFAAANRLRLPLIVHTRGNPSVYGSEHARLIIDSLFSAAPDVPIQVAHLWGGAALSEDALAVFADASTTGDPRMRRVYFDVTDLMPALNGSPQAMERVVRRMRQIGVSRLLWGSDMSPPNPPPHEAWAAFTRLPLTADELRAIAGNIAPYMQ